MREKEEDSLGLKKQEKPIRVPAGSLVVWNDRLLHASYPNATQKIRYALYLTYYPAKERSDMDNPWLQPPLGELADRLRSYETGMAPGRYPSGQRIHYMPEKWLNFHALAGRYQERLIGPQASQQRMTRNDKLVPCILEPDPRERNKNPYSPPQLSPLGSRLLGRMSWPAT